MQGLVSNDVSKVRPGHAVYACLLTPQGKFLHDFFLILDGESLLIECEADRRDDLAQRLKIYKLRSKIEITPVDYRVVAVIGTTAVIPNAMSYPDPRSQLLGTRMVLSAQSGNSVLAASGMTELQWEDYERRRIAEAVPDGSRDMEVGKAILLENNIDLLNGVAWDKGCYTGQELTARTRYRGLIKKRLVPVRIAGLMPPVGTPLIEGGVEVGEMRSGQGDYGLALLRLERLRNSTAIKIGNTTLIPEPSAALAALIAQQPA